MLLPLMLTVAFTGLLVMVVGLVPASRADAAGVGVARVAQGAQAENEPADEAPAPDPDRADFELALPDVVVRLAPGPSFEADFPTLLADLQATHGVRWAASDQAGAEPSILIGLDPDREGAALDAVWATAAAHPRHDTIAVGGRAVADEVLQSRFARAALALVVVTALMVGGLVAWLVQPRQGAVVGVNALVVGWLGSVFGARAAGVFDGSLVTTALPTVVAALVVATYLSLRLLAWFTSPQGDDLADMIRRSVHHLAPDLVLALASVVVVTLILELFDPGRSMATMFLVGVLTALILTLAVVPSALAALHGAGRTTQPLDPVAAEPLAWVRGFVRRRPTGRQFPLVVLLAFGFFFGFLSLLGLTSVTVAGLADGPDDDTSATLDQYLVTTGGDPTRAILAVFPQGGDRQAKEAWMTEVSQLPGVGRVDTSIERWVVGEVATLEGGPLAVAGSLLDGDEAPRFALVVPLVEGRSALARTLADDVAAVGGSAAPDLSGVPVVAQEAANRDRSVVVTAVILLALAAGGVALVLVGDPLVAALTAGMRLIDSLALVGLYHLVVRQVSGAELLMLVFLAGLALTLFEIAFLRHLVGNHRHPDTEDVVEEALAGDALAAVMALALVTVAGLSFVVSGSGPLLRLGIMAVIGVGIEIVVGLWLLRPAVLGARSVVHFASLPVQRVIDRLNAGSQMDDPANRLLVGVVADLLTAEFALQADPAVAPVGTVFEADTVVHQRAVEHHENLASAGLRVIGRKPQLRNVSVVALAPQVTMALTVDHPVRQLIDASDRIVGVRKAERRSLMVWLSQHPDGTYRIMDSVEMGTLPLGMGDNPTPARVGAQPAFE